MQLGDNEFSPTMRHTSTSAAVPASCRPTGSAILGTQSHSSLERLPKTEFGEMGSRNFLATAFILVIPANP